MIPEVMLVAATMALPLPQPMGEMMGEMMIGVMMVKGVSAWKVSMRKMIRLLNPKKSQ